MIRQACGLLPMPITATPVVHDGRTSRLTAHRPAPVRRSRSLIGRWQGQEFVIENYLTGKLTAVPPALMQLLDFLGENATMDQILARWAHVPAVDDLIRQLLRQDLLVEEGSELGERESRLELIWPWGHDARYFHYSTNDLEFESDPTVQRQELLDRASEAPPPSPYKDYGEQRVALDRRFEDRSGVFWEVLRRRRTCRSFTGQPISKEQLGDILLWTWGQTGASTYRGTGDLVIKTSPSGGARHPVETYPVVLAVQGIDPGIYHYSVRHNALELLRPGVFANLAVDLCSGHQWIRDAAAVFFMTAVIERSAWKYRHSHAYRVLHLDAGHLGQTFHLVCTALGLGPFTLAATRNSGIEEALGLDGVSEIVIYTAAVGVHA